MTHEEAEALIREHMDYGGNVKVAALAKALSTSTLTFHEAAVAALEAATKSLNAAGASEGQAEPVAQVNYRADVDGDVHAIAVWNGPPPPRYTKLYTHPSAEIAALRERIAGMEKAQAFAGIVLGTYRAELGDLDGFWLQDQAAAHGMIEERTANVRCGEECACAEVATLPTSCFFITEAGQAAIDAAIAKEKP